MAFIHVACLQRWRTTSPSSKSFYSCDQCGYRYKLRRAKVAGLAENNLILGALTALIFFILVILSGFVAGWFLDSYAQLTTLDNGWDQPLGPFSYDSTGKIVGEVVGEAVRVLNSKLHVEDKSTDSRPTTKPTGSPTKLTKSQSSVFKSTSRGPEVPSELVPVETDQADSPNSYRYVPSKTSDHRHHPNGPKIVDHHPHPSSKKSIDDPSLPAGRSKPSGGTTLEDEEKDEGQPGVLGSILRSVYDRLEALIKHTIKGLAFIGVMSFFQLAMSVTLFSPWNFGIRNSVLRMMRTGTTGAGTPVGAGNPRLNVGRAIAGGDPNGISSILILIFVLLGVLKAIQSVWCFVRKSSQWALRKIEDGVIDVRT